MAVASVATPNLPELAALGGVDEVLSRGCAVLEKGGHAEGEVLRLFLDSPRRLITRAQMLEGLGGAAGESFDRAMDVRISRLRGKLGEDPKNPLTDQAIVNILKKGGVNIARRTVAKYRDQLGVLSARMRKRV